VCRDAWPSNAVPRAIKMPADLHTGRDNPTGVVPSRNKAEGN